MCRLCYVSRRIMYVIKFVSRIAKVTFNVTVLCRVMFKLEKQQLINTEYSLPTCHLLLHDGMLAPRYMHLSRVVYVGRA